MAKAYSARWKSPRSARGNRKFWEGREGRVTCVTGEMLERGSLSQTAQGQDEQERPRRRRR